MMKKKIFLLFVVISIIGYAQQKNYTIKWQEAQELSGSHFSIQIPSFNKEYRAFNPDQGLVFTDQWSTGTFIDESSVSVVDVVYANINKRELADLDVKTIPNELQYSLKNVVARNKYHVLFQLSPIVKGTNGGFKKVLAFQINYKSGQLPTKKSVLTKKIASKAVVNSVLSSGEWYRFYVDTTGVFKLSKNFLQGLGVSVNTVDPRTIKVYGHGGHMIPYSNMVSYPLDVPENAIKFVGQDDGVFDNEDHILFYAQGPKAYNDESQTHINCYTDKTYYYINISPGFGKRIQPFDQPTGSVSMVIDTFDDYKYYEIDKYNLLSLGRRWFGDKFDVENDQVFDFDFPDLVTDVPLELSVAVASVSTSNSAMAITVNNTPVSTLSLKGVSSPTLAYGMNYEGAVTVDASKISVGLNFDNMGNPSTVGYLDYIGVKATRMLKFNSGQFQFENTQVKTASGIGQYNLANASQVSEIWDVTDLYNVSNYIHENENPVLSFTASLGSMKTYVALTPQDYYEPKLDTKKTINNQNIKGTIFLDNQGQFKDVDYIIVAPNQFLAQAERLSQINKNQYGLNVKVVTLDEIYNEFSSGNQDIGAIRNLVKYVYHNASAPEKRLKYLCLFGDASFDYKDRIPNNTNIVPSWHAYQSFSLASSYISDDFFGMMDPHEGNMETVDNLDIAVGRILAETPKRGDEMLDKIESYYSKESFGSWRNNFLVVSDDVDKNWEGLLQETTNNIGDLVTQKKPFINVTKIHSDAFKQEFSAGGERYPKVTTELLNAIDEGTLVINYFGHGGEDGLAEERILTKLDINNFRNKNRYNCFVTITCEFTRFDNPYRQTAGEFTYWNKEAGAISLISTTRQIYVDFAIDFNNTLGQYLFSYSDTDAYNDYEYPSMAEALRLTKTDLDIARKSQRRLVFFIGDPAMKLVFPKPNIKLTQINDVSITQPTDTLKALSRVKLAGEVTDVSGNLIPNYNGVLATTIYDKPINRETLSNDGISNNGQVVKLNFTTLGEIIFRGQASIVNGQFEFDFVVPKDISVLVGLGKISFYSNDATFISDQSGGTSSVLMVGGINENAPEDNTGPIISLYMNDENFVSGGITNEEPTLIAKLEDINGINTASGVGHDIVAVLDGDETNPFVLNDYYQTELDDYSKGTLSFPFRDLKPGLHTLTLKAWDVYNNSSVSEIQFVVFDKDQGLVINNVLNYPNPFVNYTEFWFNHNSSESLDVSIQIFTVSGKLVRTINTKTSGGQKATSSLSRDAVWDGRDDFGEKIGKGVYIYKLQVHSPLLNKTVEKIEKLVIL